MKHMRFLPDETADGFGCDVSVSVHATVSVLVWVSLKGHHEQ